MSMGGEKVVIGYRYYLGMHMAFCHMEVDGCSRIRVDRRVAWQGFTTGRISIDTPDLFGGKSREGGVSGDLDLETGSATQTQNDYLLAQLGSLVPAFRGVSCAVLRQMYLGNNPYLKDWEFKLQRIHKTTDGATQWYDARAAIGSLFGSTQAVHIALDTSNSMNQITGNGYTRLQNAKTAINGFLDYLLQMVEDGLTTIDVMVVGWDGSKATMTQRDIDAADVSALKSFINGLHTLVPRTVFSKAVEDVASFFAGAPVDAQRTVVFLTDGLPYEPGKTEEEIAQAGAELLFATSGIASYAMNIDLTDTTYTAYMDNTAGDGVPVISGGDPDALTNLLKASITGQVDMNPAHIVRECITNPDWGMGYTSADVDTSFTACADTLYDEGFGLSLLWDTQTPIEDFVAEVLRTINAALYVSRDTGLWTMKLIRDDYTVGSLPVLDAGNVERIEDFGRPALGELVSQMTVRYWDAQSDHHGAVTVTDDALAQMQGQVSAVTLTYEGISNYGVAARIAQRELNSLSQPLASGKLVCFRSAGTINVGDPFVLHWDDYGLQAGTVVRAVKVNYGDERDGRVAIHFTEDAFYIPATAVTKPVASAWQNPVSRPSAMTRHGAVEAPYYQLVRLYGQSVIDAQIALDNTLGFIRAFGARPTSDAITARIWTDDGGGYEDQDATTPFCPTAILAADLGIKDLPVTVAITGGIDLEEVEPGSFAQIGNELVRVDALSETSITVGRGLLDTLPEYHASGEVIHFWDGASGTDGVQYADSESIGVKLLPVTGLGVLELTAATADTVVMASRANAPYPPGQIKQNALYYPNSLPHAALALTWAHRDRTQQTGATLNSFEEGDIGPEAGVTYEVNVWDETDTQVVADTGLTGTTWDYTDERTDLNTLVGSPSGLFIRGSEVPPEVPSLALQAEYLFDSDTTNLPDTTGVYDGTITGALYRPCHLFPYRLQFANGDRVDINHALDLASFSVAVWWRANSAGRRLVDTRGTGTIGVVKGFQIKNYNTGSNDYCVADDGAGNYIMLEPSASPLSKNPIDGDFHLFVVSWDDTNKTLKFWLDANLEYTVQNLSMGSIRTTVRPHYLGFPSNGWNSTQNYTGTLSRVRIYNGLVSQADVDLLYAERQPGNNRLIVTLPTGVLTGWTQWLSGTVSLSTEQDYSGDGKCLKKQDNDDPNGAYHEITPFNNDDEVTVVECRCYRASGYTGNDADRICFARDSYYTLGMSVNNASAQLAVNAHTNISVNSSGTDHDLTSLSGGAHLDEWRRFVFRFDAVDPPASSTLLVNAYVYDAAGNLLAHAFDYVSGGNGADWTRFFIIGGSEYYIDALKITHYGPAYAPGAEYRYNAKIRAKLLSRRDGFASLQAHDITFYRNGYGYRYGSHYGGTS